MVSDVVEEHDRRVRNKATKDIIDFLKDFGASEDLIVAVSNKYGL